MWSGRHIEDRQETGPNSLFGRQPIRVEGEIDRLIALTGTHEY